MEQLAIPPAVMRKRVEETLDLLGLADLRSCALHQLSAGQLQRVAIGAVLTAHPKVLVLDEPTSALDPTGAEEVLASITRLVHDLGVTVVMAEHRLERVVQYADSRRVRARRRHASSTASPAELLARTSVAPPIVELGRLAGWDPLPLSVRDARRRATDAGRRRSRGVTPPPAVPAPSTAAPIALRARGIVVRYDARRRGARRRRRAAGRRDHRAHGPQRRGQVVVAVGAPRHRTARRRPRRRRGRRSRRPRRERGPHARRARAADAVRPAVPRHGRRGARAGRRASRAPSRAAARALLDRIAPGMRRRRAPPRPVPKASGSRSCSRSSSPPTPRVVLLDEPTRGLDYDAKHAPGARCSRELAADGPRDRGRRRTTSSSSPRPRTASW